MSNTLYDQDFHAWAMRQAALLREGRLDQADIENIAEEIESMGRSEKREPVSRLAVLLLHLLTWRAQPGLRGNRWRLTIKGQRRSLTRHLRDNPSLKGHMGAAIRDAYETAQLDAERETGLPADHFPATCPFSLEQIMGEDFWPD
jgi:hypothetical protein